MSLSLNGSSTSGRSFRFEINELSQVGEARRFANQMMVDPAFDVTTKGRISILITELGSNLARHAQKGELVFRLTRVQKRPAFEILAIDHGPGLPDTDLCFRDGYSSGDTPGTGLGAIRRQSDVFDYYTNAKGTVILSLAYPDRSNKLEPESNAIGVVCLPVGSEIECGDGWGVWEDEPEKLILVVDGLGHGPLASRAAKEALLAIQENALAQSLESLVADLHAALRGTRGAALSVVRMSRNEEAIRHVGVGNIRASVAAPDRKSKSFISYPGTIGLQYRTAKEVSIQKEAHGVVILHSDGLQQRWEFQDHPGLLERHPRLIAGYLYREYSRGTDDSTVLVVGGVH